MILGVPPFNDETVDKIFDNIVNVRYSWHDCEEISEKAKDLISNLLVADRTKRFTCEQIMSHPFFEGIDWVNLKEITPPFVPTLDNEDDTSYFQDHGSVGSLGERESIEDLDQMIAGTHFGEWKSPEKVRQVVQSFNF